eukprot:15465196-Alexandrium_andersonii.AAC.1
MVTELSLDQNRASGASKLKGVDAVEALDRDDPHCIIRCSEEWRSQLDRRPTHNWVPGAMPIPRK